MQANHYLTGHMEHPPPFLASHVYIYNRYTVLHVDAVDLGEGHCLCRLVIHVVIKGTVA